MAGRFDKKKILGLGVAFLLIILLLPFAHHHPHSLVEPPWCPANIMEHHLLGGQIVLFPICFAILILVTILSLQTQFLPRHLIPNFIAENRAPPAC